MKTTLLLAFLAISAGAQTKLDETLRKGILEEESKQNLTAAIQAYQSVLTQFDDERKTAATALFRMAESYRKLGRNAEAIAAYNRVLRDFPDQTKLVEQSRTHLGGSNQQLPAGTISQMLEAERAQDAIHKEAWGRYRMLKEEEIKLMEQQLAQLQKQVDLGTADPERMIAARMGLLKLKQELAAFDAGNGPPKR